MALTNSRPFQIPTSTDDNEILLNTTSPVFQASALGYSTKLDPITATASDVFPLISSSTDLTGSNTKSKKEQKKEKEAPALEISKIIPVTGERPMPSDRSSPLDDEVLYTVFVILWEKDTEQQGMTVKQLCDHLLEKNPEMSNLSTKLSNLISAKLNAYVKKLEKAEKTLTYALSREWSDSSPRRMLYVYRGILSPDYKEHAQAATEQLKQQQQLQQQMNASTGNDSKSNGGSISSENFLDETISFSKKVGIPNNLAFTLGSEFNIPYSTSPVSANLTPRGSKANISSPIAIANTSNSVKGNLSSNKKRSISEDAFNSKEENNSKSTSKKVKSNSNTSSSSNLNSNAGSNKNGASDQTPATTYITAAAAAPRLSKFSSKDSFKGNSQNSVGILSAIHKVISTQTPIDSISSSGQYNDSAAFSPTQINDSLTQITTWMKQVREGFLTQDIESPESLSLDDLDSIFN